jgi:NAD-dependent dihydropyrimidine dehydrogenase PreA subunit
MGWDYVDLGVLAVALGVSAWLIYRKRSRRGLVGLSIFSLLYFGFWRNGCVCAIGSFQNVALALGDKGYALPIVVTGFFVLPLMVALFAGRAFCAGVCPHGALQDLVLVKPLKVPGWLEQGLSILPFIYLGAGVLFAATGAAFLVCQYDPFVPVFRMSGRGLMVAAGVTLLVLGMFVGRPYCRFLCPFGALLKISSAVAKFRVRVTPNVCTQCRLCEASCPFGAMRLPEAQANNGNNLKPDRRRLVWALAALPVLIAVGVWAGSRFATPAARLHPDVSLAHQLIAQKDHPLPTGALTPAQLEIRRALENPREVLQQAIRKQDQFRIGGILFGGWVGLVIGAKLISLSVRRQRTDYEPDRGDCFACARCFQYCPNELVRRGVVPAAISPAETKSGGFST